MAGRVSTRCARLRTGLDWLHEIKLDGYRMFALRDGDRVRLISRSGVDWTCGFPMPGPRSARGAAERRAAEGGSYGPNGGVAGSLDRAKAAFHAVSERPRFSQRGAHCAARVAPRLPQPAWAFARMARSHNLAGL
jgi:hypothetical protein